MNINLRIIAQENILLKYGEIGRKIESIEIGETQEVVDYTEEEMSKEPLDIDIINWGKYSSKDNDNITIRNVKNIYQQEPDNITVIYKNAKIKEIPEDLFYKKVNCKIMSKFIDNNTIEKIPEDLYKNSINAIHFDEIFKGCIKIKEIPENLFKNNNRIVNMIRSFKGCSSIKHIPENLIKRMKNRDGGIDMFTGCIGADNYANVPEPLKL